MFDEKQGLVEDMLRMLIRNEHCSPKTLFYAMHNVFCHGEVMDDIVSFTSDELAEAFDCFDRLIDLNWE